jgi:hypothetical protein
VCAFCKIMEVVEEMKIMLEPQEGRVEKNGEERVAEWPGDRRVE